MDQENPAISDQLIVPPTLLAAAAKDPKVISEQARKLLLVELAITGDLFKNPQVPMGQRLTYLDLLTKLSGVVTAAAAPVAQGPGFQVQIVFPEGMGKPRKVVDVEATEVPETPAYVKAVEAATNKMMINIPEFAEPREALPE
ncbi:MAG: hypothetical protein HXX17_07950 [Geobacteraceae bacterium]|nr:hypothetical protein [Geobacteraceae bacterium]